MGRSHPCFFMSTSIKDRLKTDMITAMKAQEKDRLACIRFIQAAIKKVEIDTRKDLTDADVIGILTNQAKQRKDSITQFRTGGREDLAAKEEAELVILQSYLPQQLSGAEIEALVADAVKKSGATAAKDMGLVMKILMPQIAGKADGAAVSALVKAKLQ